MFSIMLALLHATAPATTVTRVVCCQCGMSRWRQRQSRGDVGIDFYVSLYLLASTLLTQALTFLPMSLLRSVLTYISSQNFKSPQGTFEELGNFNWH